MKFLHTADLHLGRRLNDIPLLQDQRKVLAAIVDIAKQKKVDAVLLSGDIYDRAAPSAECYVVLSDFVTALSSSHIAVIAISGNHDSNERVGYLSALLKYSNVYFSDVFDGSIGTVALKDEYGEVLFHLLPFVRPSDVRLYYPDERIESYQDAIKVLLSHHPIDKGMRNVILSHQFVAGAQICDSEILSLGGSEAVEASLYRDYDYVALGHIHRSQKMTEEKIRYAGSIMKYSLSEEKHVKSVTLVELREKGKTSIETVALPIVHDVRTIRGHFKDLMSMPYSEDFVHVVLLDENVVFDARLSLGTVFPNMIRFSIENSKTTEEVDIQSLESIEKKSLPDLFEAFYSMQFGGQKPDEKRMQALRNVLKGLEEENKE